MPHSAANLETHEPTSVVVASTAAHFEAFASLIGDFWEWTELRYTDHRELIDEVASQQGLAGELNALSTVYGPPQGKCLLAVRDGHYCGGIAYRNLGDGSCEMKRLFVRDEHRGHGIGRLLCEALVTTATSDGFHLMRLDTGYLNDEAGCLYESFGFRRCPPHHDYPDELMPYVRFMETPLVEG